MTITIPGVYNLPADEYHAHPALSASGAKLLLPPSCPALFRHAQLNGTASTRALEDGNLAHALVLGDGIQAEVYPADLLAKNGAASTDAAKAWAAEVYARGNIPVKADRYAVIREMADAIRRHPIAGRLFRDGGKAEQSMFWQDPDVDTARRARLDWLPNDPSASGRLIISDYKTARTAHPDTWRKAAADLGYHRQHANYIAGAKALRLAEDVAMVYVVQEKTPPYLVSVVQLDAEAAAMGAAQMTHAARILAHCIETDHWPDYTDGQIVPVSLPTYYIINAEQELEDAS